MNIQTADILRILSSEPYSDTRTLASETGYSRETVRRGLIQLKNEGYLDHAFHLTPEAENELLASSPKTAVILAAGFGMRMVPINTAAPKALLEVRGERLIDRLIKQLHEAGIEEITVVAGFMKESFEYLIDEFNVDLVINSEYASGNNLHSLALVSSRIHNTYIIPCDLWCKNNPFSKHELYSWYMVSDRFSAESTVRVNRRKELTPSRGGNRMIGISYLKEPEASMVREKLKLYDADGLHVNSFWEDTLFEKNRLTIYARAVKDEDVTEINTYEQLRELDSGSHQLQSDAISTIADVFHCDEEEVTDIRVLKKGMTNRSFLFTCRENQYIMRIPGEGTDQLINRRQEYEVYQAISGHGLCEDPEYFNPDNGYKITRFLKNARTCDPHNEEDLKRCMAKLREFHAMRLEVDHTFDLFREIDFYESLWQGTPSVYRDYAKTKTNVLSLKAYIDSMDKDRCLTHIDAVADNFLFYDDGSEEEALQLTDWEYAGMQDPHVDLAMFCIYSLYSKQECDHLIDLYFEGSCDITVRARIYCYIAVCGLLWSNWCEYKRNLGVEFGEYSLRQYRYAKDYYRYANEMVASLKELK